MSQLMLMLVRHAHRSIAGLLVLSVAAVAASAQQPVTAPARRADSVATSADSLGRQQRLKTVTIAASPLALDAPSNSVRLTPARLKDLPANSPWDALRQAAGIEVHQQGQGPGFASDASMRGFSSDHSTDLALWIDGVPINEPVNGHAEGYADWSLLFPRAVSGIDIARGPTSVLFGNFAMAGSVNVQTLERLRGSVLSLDGGSFGRTDASLLTGFDHGASGGGVFGVRFAREDGFRPNATNSVSQGHARVTHDLSSIATIDGGVELYDATWYSPGFLSEDEFARGEYGIVSNPTDGGYRRRAQERVSLRIISGRLVWRTTAYATQSRWQLFLTIPPAGGRFEGTGSQTEEEDARFGLGLTSAATWALPVGELTVGGETRWDRARYENYFTSARRRDSVASALDAHQGSGGVFAAFEADLSARIHISVGARVDQFSTTSMPDSAAAVSASHGTFSPKIGLAARLTEDATAFANVSRGFRSTDGVISDPTLPLIQTWAYEAGIRLRRGDASTTVALYRMNVNNEQTFDPLTRGSSSGGASRRQGVEVDWTLPVVWSITTHGAWSFNDAIYTSSARAGDNPASPTILSGLRVYNTSKYVGSADAEWATPDRAVTARVGGTFVGSYAPFDEPGVELGGYGLLHLSGSARVAPRASVRVMIRNALDRRYPELIAGHIVSPGQPRAFGAGLDLTF